MVLRAEEPLVSGITSDVLDLARQKDVASCLHPLLALAGVIFPGSSIAARVERDAEIDSEQHIVIEVDVRGWSVDDMFAARNRWSQQFRSICPAQNSVVFQIRPVQNA